MKFLIGGLALAGFAFGAAAVSPAQTAGVQELGRFLGTWTNSGTLLDTPYSKAGSATGTTTCVWSEEQLFMICQQRISINGIVDRAISVYTYDASQGRYHFYHVGSSGGSGSPIAIDDKTVTYTDSFSDKGHQVTIRTLNVWESATLYRWRTEYSSNDGALWSLMASGTSQR